MAMQDTYRTCRFCGFNGYMDLWIKKRIYPHVIALLLLLLGLIPGIIFMVRNRYTLICPHCGKNRD
jgi:hypothetical protein